MPHDIKSITFTPVAAKSDSDDSEEETKSKEVVEAERMVAGEVEEETKGARTLFRQKTGGEEL